MLKPPVPVEALSTTIEKLCVFVAPPISVTVAVSVKVPDVGGTPVILPLAWNDSPEFEMAPTGDQV